MRGEITHHMSTGQAETIKDQISEDICFLIQLTPSPPPNSTKVIHIASIVQKFLVFKFIIYPRNTYF